MDVIIRKIEEFQSDDGKIIKVCTKADKYINKENVKIGNNPAKDVLYVGQTQVMIGEMPDIVTFIIDADNLSQAFEKFDDASKTAVSALKNKLAALYERLNGPSSKIVAADSSALKMLKHKV